MRQRKQKALRSDFISSHQNFSKTTGTPLRCCFRRGVYTINIIEIFTSRGSSVHVVVDTSFSNADTTHAAPIQGRQALPDKTKRRKWKTVVFPFGL